MLSLSIDRCRRGRGLVAEWFLRNDGMLVMDGWRDRESKEGRMGGLRRGSWKLGYDSKVKVFVLGDTPHAVRRLNDKHRDRCDDNDIVSRVRQVRPRGGSCPP